mmetsp:Transcript_79170/g.132214  ORF Transcript_79170/g.132214 Transcript_79170/m.132214 type:complete len:122 (+) Transcript_79170:2-367(+)
MSPPAHNKILLGTVACAEPVQDTALYDSVEAVVIKLLGPVAKDRSLVATMLATPCGPQQHPVWHDNMHKWHFPCPCKNQLYIQILNNSPDLAMHLCVCFSGLHFRSLVLLVNSALWIEGQL